LNGWLYLSWFEGHVDIHWMKTVETVALQFPANKAT
jgi:hypothetical protein